MSRRVNIPHQLFRVLLLTAMVLGLVLPGAAGAQGPRDSEQVGAVDLLAVGPATVTVEPCDMGLPAKYTVVFETTQDLSVGGSDVATIRIRFPADTNVPDPSGYDPTTGYIKVNGTGVNNIEYYQYFEGTPPTVVTDNMTYEIEVPFDIPAGTVTVTFELLHNLINPTTIGDYQLEVSTSREVLFVPSHPYNICMPSGRVYVYRSRFDALEECGQKQLDFVDSFDTIQEALDFVDDEYLADPWPLYTGDDPENNPFGQVVGMEVHVAPDTYAETIIMDTPGVVLKSMAGPAVTIIDGSGIEPQMIVSSTLSSVFDGMAGVVNILASGVTFEGFTVTGGGVGVSSQDPDNYGVDNYPDYDQNGNVDIQGIFVTPWNPKANQVAGGMVITDTADYTTTYPIYSGRVNVYGNVIHGNEGFGIVAAAAMALDINQDGSIDSSGPDVYFNVKAEGSGLVALIEGNVIHDNRGGGIVGVDLSCGVEVIDPTSITVGTEAASEILNNAIRSNGFATMPDGEPAFNPIVSTGNTTAAMLGSGISLYGTVQPYYSDWGGSEGCCTVFIVNNEILGNTNNGISLWKDAANVPLVIQENTITQNGFAGVSTAAEALCDGEVAVDFRYNDVVGNGVWGVKNWAGDLQQPLWFNAKENYWGSMGGPSEGSAPEPHKIDQRSDALGNGDAVSHYVYYNPWLSVSQATVIADGIRHYGSYLELQKGWNTLSVPVPLHGSADTLGEIATLGSWLDNAQAAFQYDPSLGYIQLLSNTQLLTGRGYFIRMAEAGRFPVIYRSSFGLPSVNLAQGWNLVGAAFGIDRVDNATPYDQGRWAIAWAARLVDGGDPEARKPSAVALDSVRNQASVIISPSVPGQIASWSSTYTQEAQASSPNYFYTGEAYWVFMIDPGTLAGFEVTPFHFTPDLHDWFCCHAR